MATTGESTFQDAPNATSVLTADFDDIAKSLDTIEEQLAFIVDRDDLGTALCETVELGHRVTALTARLGLQASNNLVANNYGQRTMGQYVAARTNGAGTDVDRLINLAKWVRDFPVLEAAFGVELTQRHLDYLRKKLDTNYHNRQELIADQQFFVDTAASCSFVGFTKACDYWLVHVDPDGKEPTDQIEKSRLRIGKGQGGRGEITGTCDAVTASAIRTAVEHEANKLRIADKDAAIERTDTQRNMAALAALVARGFARSDGTFPAPLGNIVMSQAVAEWALNTLNGDSDSETVPVHPTDVDGRCELIDGTPIHPFLAVAALGLIGPAGTIKPANLRRYILDADSRLLDVSVNARSFPEWMRTALLVQSRGECDTHGCESPHGWIEIDHTQPVFHGGETRVGNGQPQCRPDNQHKGATPNQTPWRDKPPPPRRRPRTRPQTFNNNDDDDDDDNDNNGPF